MQLLHVALRLVPDPSGARDKALDSKRSARMSSSRKDAALLCARAHLGEAPATMDNPLTVLASPAWRGVEGDIWQVSSPTESFILKHYHPDIAFYVDVAASMRASEMAGDAGIGPSVTGMWASDGIIAFEELAPPWRSGGLSGKRC